MFLSAFGNQVVDEVVIPSIALGQPLAELKEIDFSLALRAFVKGSETKFGFGHHIEP